MRAFQSSCVLAASLCFAIGAPGAATDDAKQEVQVNVDGARGEALPCRVHLTDATGKPVTAAGLPFWKDHFCCSGRATLQLPVGRYRYEVEHGPEHQRLRGTLEVKAGRDHALHLQLQRIADLAKSGWYSGDLHVHRPLADIELLMKAEDLHVAPVITWWNATNPWAARKPPRELLRRFDCNRFTHVMAGEDERGGGALLYFHLSEPLPITKAAREHPPAVRFAEQARRQDKNVWIDIEKPFWWDVPAWLASGIADSIEIANNHMCRSQMYANEAWGRPRDERRLPNPLGNGWWTQEIYYHLLNCGLRLPPSAGSASGVLPNPVGYNRVYVHVDGDLTYEKWWAGLKAGRSFVTNGPLLTCRANGQLLPGHVFLGEKKGQPVQVRLDITLTGLDPVPRLEIIRDGKVADTIELDEGLTQQRTANLTFKESGWFLMRAVADNKETFRFASTAPYYVEIGDRKHRISKRSAQFFLDWVGERIDRLREAKMSDEERREVIAEQEKARHFWQGVLERANVE
jgi:hypothetical protein